MFSNLTCALSPYDQIGIKKDVDDAGDHLLLRARFQDRGGVISSERKYVWATQLQRAEHKRGPGILLPLAVGEDNPHNLAMAETALQEVLSKKLLPAEITLGPLCQQRES